MAKHFPRIPFGSRLLSVYLDNMIYRRAIHMDAFGHIRTDSPVLVAHLVGLTALALNGLAFLAHGWAGVSWACLLYTSDAADE